jgi:hypothetical protein
MGQFLKDGGIQPLENKALSWDITWESAYILAGIT